MRYEGPDLRETILDYACPLCHAREWDEGHLTLLPVAGDHGFNPLNPYTSTSDLMGIMLFTCQRCRYVASLSLGVEFLEGWGWTPPTPSQ
jgi:hypothetical protein